jgi:hypothetical protein
VGFEGSGEEAMVRLAFPMGELVARVREGVEALACDAGLLLAEAVVKDEVESRVGPVHARLPERQASRRGQEAGYIAFAGRKVPFRRPRVRDAAGHEERVERVSNLQMERVSNLQISIIPSFLSLRRRAGSRRSCRSARRQAMLTAE